LGLLEPPVLPALPVRKVNEIARVELHSIQIRICLLLALVAIVLLEARGLPQANAKPAPTSSPTVIDTCVSRAAGVGRVVASASECRQDEYFVAVYQLQQQAQAIATPAQAVFADPGLPALTASLIAYRSVFCASHRQEPQGLPECPQQ
jgi:hypothetical protein